MGKNHKHKKMLKSEKGKIKLKVKNEKTKFLPKGLNVTRTDFKIKPIVLPEQLKQKNALELLSNRKLNVKDILIRLGHYNVSQRHGAVNELKQIIHAHIDELASQHLAQIMHGLPPLLLDDVPAVRKTVMTCLEKMLEQVSEEKIMPFFGILSSYLRCSMTNINRNIQEDSLQFLAILLKHVPQLIADERHKVLPNLFALISKMKVEANPVRTLSINLNSKLTSVRWHIIVLSGIYGFLKAINAGSNDSLLKSQSFIELSANKKAGKHVPLIHNSYLNNKIAFNYDLSMVSTEKDDVIEKNLKTLLTLLYEIWIEVAPEKNLRALEDFAMLQNDTAAILSCVLNVLHLLYVRLLGNNQDGDLNCLRDIFFTNDCKKFLQNVMLSFPFTKSSERTKQDNSNIQRLLNQHLISDVKFVRENLLVCYLFCNLNKRLVHPATIKDAGRVLKYVEHCLTTRNFISNVNIDCLLLVVRTLFFDNILWHNKVDIENILFRFVNFYEQQQTVAENSDKKKSNQILDVLCEVSHLSHLNRNKAYQKWLGNISASLGAKEVSENVLDALVLVGKQNNVEFLAGLRTRMPLILQNYNNIIITNLHKNQEEYIAKLKILCLFYYLPSLEANEIEALKKFQLNCKQEQENSMIDYLLKKCAITLVI